MKEVLKETFVRFRSSGFGSRIRLIVETRLRPRKVVAVGIWVGFGPELGSEKNNAKKTKSRILMYLKTKRNLPI